MAEPTTPAARPLLDYYQDGLSAPEAVATGIAIAFALAVLLTSIYTNILRDQSLAERKPFSLARVQLMWWTLVVGLCVIIYCGVHVDPPVITGTCLVLLGIGAATTMTARIIDDRQRDNLAAAGNLPLHQDVDKRQRNMLEDILSDEGGVSVHRFQSFVFNLVYGISFLYSFCTTSIFPEYNAEALALLGISSASYVGLKAFENKAPPRGSPGVSDELIDGNTPPNMTAAG
jgi:hypothetical protein